MLSNKTKIAHLRRVLRALKREIRQGVTWSTASGICEHLLSAGSLRRPSYYGIRKPKYADIYWWLLNDEGHTKRVKIVQRAIKRLERASRSTSR